MKIITSINDVIKNLKKEPNLGIDLPKLILEYTKFIDKIGKKNERIGVICENIISCELIEKKINFIIIPASCLESQIHREYASSFNGEVILEINSINQLNLAEQFVVSASSPHTFMSVGSKVKIEIKKSMGNNNINILDANKIIGNEKLNRMRKYIYTKEECKYECKLNEIKSIINIKEIRL
jgi:phospho-2-dehydro-3-deoxyheptonate aldolase